MIFFKDEANLDEAISESKTFKGGESATLKERNAVIGALQEIATGSQEEILNYLDIEKSNGNVKSYDSFFIVNAINVIAKKDVIEKISLSDNVQEIRLNEKIYQDVPIVEPAPKRQKRSVSENEIEWNLRYIGADSVWASGIRGNGVTVGILDSAVDLNHPALKEKFRGYDPVTKNVTYEGNYIDCVKIGKEKPDSDTDVEHGSHCMGIILGSEKDSNGNEYNNIGVAPDAKFISARIFDDLGKSTEAGFFKAAEWMMKPGGDPSKAPQIINNSWGGGQAGNTNPWFQRAVTAWRKANILPVFAAGNQLYYEPAPGPKSISAPANYKDSFAVAAIDKEGKLAPFSKKGPSPFSDVKEYKPEVSAPGVTIRSSVKNGYLYMSGTSMAAPHVAGAAALLKSSNFNLTETQIRELLQKTAVPATDGENPTSPNHAYGYGIINVHSAISEINGTGNGTVSGKIQSEGKGVRAEIIIKETGRTVQSDETTGMYTMNHPAGKYTLVCNAYGYDKAEKQIEIKKEISNESNFELKAKNKSNVTVMVKDEKGTPVENAYVRFLEDSSLGIAESDSEGKVAVQKVNAGTYNLRVFKDGYEAYQEEIKIDGGEKTIEVTLKSRVKDDYVDVEFAYDNGVPNRHSEENFGVGGTYRGVAVRFVPTKQNGIIKNCSIYFMPTDSVTSKKSKTVSQKS